MSLPPPPKGPKRAFVSYLDSHVGAHLVSKLISLDYEVTGVVRNQSSIVNVNSKVKKVLLRTDADQIRKGLLEAEYIVYHTPGSAEDSINAVRLLSSNHYESEKRFVLVSSILSWFETPALVDPAPTEEGEEPELEALTEDQFNRRVPHVKYQAWRDVEKLCASHNSERLKTFVVFAGLPYGLGENLLGPMFKQAWTLAPEGLPIYATGKQVVPMIHTTDLVTFVSKILGFEEIPESRYYFAVDDGNCSWNQIVGAINGAIGNGKTFRVPLQELGLHDNVEHFVVNLKIEASQIQSTMGDEDWVAKSGFVENVESVCQQYRSIRGVTPLRVCVLGPPSVGKSFTSRELAGHFGVPHFNIMDVITEYKYQEVELQEEIVRLKAARVEQKRSEKVEEKRQALLEQRRTEAESAALEVNTEGGSSQAPPALPPDPDDDDIDEDEDDAPQLTADEEKELREAADEEMEGDEGVAAINEKLNEIKRVLAMRQKPLASEVAEPPNPKDKKKPAPKAKKTAEPAEAKEEPVKEFRLSDRALGFMVKWKLSRTECRNQGYILDGYPRTVRQARLVFEDVPVEVPEDPEEAELPLDKEEKPCADLLFPDYVIHLKAGDTFLLERLLKTQFEHPHNTPEDFQRRLEIFKNHFDVPGQGVLQYLESARTATNNRATVVRGFGMEGCPLVPPPPPASQYATRPVDPQIQSIIEFIGKPHNFGPTPEDLMRSEERARNLANEIKAEQAAKAKERASKEAADVAQAQQAQSQLDGRVKAMKEQEREMLEQRKGPLKAYLMSNVIPVLTKGLIEVCNRRPDDPVDFLAEWLFKHNPEDHPEMYA